MKVVWNAADQMVVVYRMVVVNDVATMAVTRAVKVAIYAFATVEANVVVLKVVEKLLSQNIYAKLMEAVPAVSMMDAIEARKVVDSVDVMEEGSDVWWKVATKAPNEGSIAPHMVDRDCVSIQDALATTAVEVSALRMVVEGDVKLLIA